MMAKAGTFTYAREKPNPPGLCRICGQFCMAIATHLKYSHDMTLEEYYKKYPQARRKEAIMWATQRINY